MELTKKDLLDKTHYGLKIYAFILELYYQGNSEIFLTGKVCKPIKNPYRDHSPTLILNEIDGQFLYSDSKDEFFKGDPFDFAALHFKTKDDLELLQHLNEEMHLHIGENPWHKDHGLNIEIVKEVPKPKIILPTFSYFKAPVKNTVPAKEVNLIEVYQMIKAQFKKQTEGLRAIANKTNARHFKASKFDYVTFSGVFSKRSDKELIKHSGLLAIDFDHVAKLPELIDHLLNDEYFDTEILFTSPSGDGLKWIVPIDITEHGHKDWFTAIKNYIRESYQLEVDSAGKDVSRACFLPHDANIYLHPKYHS